MVKQSAYALFETPLGVCGIAWMHPDGPGGEPVLIAFQLPEAAMKATEAWIARKSGAQAGAPPPRIAEIIKKVKQHFGGAGQDFQDIAVDLDGASPFAKQVCLAARKILSGRTMTYGELANAMNRPAAARAVGQALGKNPIPLIIPCHRVLASGNQPRGFSAHSGLATKAKMLEMEGATLGPPPVIKTIKDLNQAAALLKKKDPRLARILSQPIDFRRRREHDPYETLVVAVVHQQLSPKAAATILARIKALYPGKKLPGPGDMIKTPDEQLRNAGLSRSKTRAIKDIATKTLDGTVPTVKEIQSLGNEEIIKRLTSIYGVGKWTVEMLLIFNLGRADVLPVDDYALRKSIADVFRMKQVPTPKQAARLGERWRPYRTVASLYLWNSVKL
jgi:O-6-methylguanine DNA methyltransferase